MHHFFEAITNTSGDSLVGYFARVIDPANQNTVTLASDNNGTPIVTVSGVENMAKTDENGNLSLYVQPGTYHLDIYAPNASSFILRVPNVAMNSGKGDKGDPGSVGPAGPANSTYTSLSALKAAPQTNRSYILADGTNPPVTYAYVAGNFTGRAEDVNVVKLDAVPLTTGALVRQGAQSVSFRAGGASAVNRDLQSKARDFVSVLDFGAKGDGLTDDTAAIQAAINSGAPSIVFPAGQYLHRGLVVTMDYQRFYGPGAKLTRIQADTTIAISGRGVHLVEMRFGCQTGGMAGNNLTVSGPDFRALYCESRDCGGRALLVANAGGGVMVHGGAYQTTDVTAGGYDIELRDDAGGGNTLYCWISNIITNQHTGGILLTGEVGSSAIEASEYGKLRMDATGAAKVSNCRIGGAVTILSGFASFEQNDFNDDVTFGQDGAAPNIGSLRFAATNSQKAGKAFKISDNVVESTFHLGQIAASGSVITINGYNNDLWHPERDVVIGIGAQSGAPALGNATVTARMSSAGRRRMLSVDLQFGTTTSFGGGNFFYFTVPFKARSSVVSTAQVTDAGVGFFDLVARQLGESDQVYFFPSSGGGAAVGNGASATNPFTWANGDRIIFNIVAEQAF